MGHRSCSRRSSNLISLIWGWVILSEGVSVSLYMIASDCVISLHDNIQRTLSLYWEKHLKIAWVDNLGEDSFKAVMCMLLLSRIKKQILVLLKIRVNSPIDWICFVFWKFMITLFYITHEAFVRYQHWFFHTPVGWPWTSCLSSQSLFLHL